MLRQADVLQPANDPVVVYLVHGVRTGRQSTSDGQNELLAVQVVLHAQHLLELVGAGGDQGGA